MNRRTIISAVMLVAGIILLHTCNWFEDNKLVQFIYFAVAFLPVGLPVIGEAIECAREKDYFSEFTLMSVACIGAFAIGEYPEGVAVMLFYSIGEYLQEKAVDRAQKDIGALLSQMPQTARLSRNGQVMHPREVPVGEKITVMAGERVPLDGQLVSKDAFFNTAALTGESTPRKIHTAEEVSSGMIVSDSVVEIVVTKPFDEGAIAKVLKMVEEAAERKAPTEQFIRRFARVYTPLMMGMAVLIAVAPLIYSLVSQSFVYQADVWVYRALMFLVISCPCALVISIPLGYFGGIAAASKHGILFKGGNYLDAITKVNAVVFDKTGTLTQGVFEVQNEVDDQLLRMVASVEQFSNHPIAKAIIKHAQGRSTVWNSLYKVTDVQEIAGEGLTAIVDGKMVLAGGKKLMQSHQVAYPEHLEANPHTIVCCAVAAQTPSASEAPAGSNVPAENRPVFSFAGYILLADTLKEDAKDAIADLKKLGISDITLLSGDNQEIVSDMAQKLTIPASYGNLSPKDKLVHLEQIAQSRNVAFVGDGINDAPVLTAANVGIAIGALGSDAAIECADVVLQTGHPSRTATAIKIGRATKSIVIQNIVMALSIKCIVLILGMCLIVSLWAAVFADTGVALLAVLNALRIRKK